MFLRVFAYITSLSALAALFMVLVIVIALDLALVGVIDGAALVHALMPVFDVLLWLAMMLGEALPSIDQPIEPAVVRMIYLN